MLCSLATRHYDEQRRDVIASAELLRTQPCRPKALYEMALVYRDLGKEEKELEYLKKALFVGEEADSDYKPAKLAREKLAKWTM